MKCLSHGNVKAPIIRRGRPMLFRIVAVPEFWRAGRRRTARRASCRAGTPRSRPDGRARLCRVSSLPISVSRLSSPTRPGSAARPAKVAPGAREQRRGIAQVQRGKQLLIWKQRGAGHPDRPAIIDYIHFMLTLRTASQQHSRSLPLDDFDGGPSRILGVITPHAEMGAVPNAKRPSRTWGENKAGKSSPPNFFRSRFVPPTPSLTTARHTPRFWTVSRPTYRLCWTN